MSTPSTSNAQYAGLVPQDAFVRSFTASATIPDPESNVKKKKEELEDYIKQKQNEINLLEKVIAEKRNYVPPESDFHAKNNTYAKRLRR